MSKFIPFNDDNMSINEAVQLARDIAPLYWGVCPVCRRPNIWIMEDPESDLERPETCGRLACERKKNTELAKRLEGHEE